ncbi:TIGR02587 family membrane protein [Sphingomonas sabuli]|uniref:TIGR02587 family membrane protein n=1 Tax=Sphingomonas sabuli TaxID=2764186 RepID=A0A7G9L1K5_9SPHN|nr:TIGR02587 family membrane protein [Sphingomonas sabuli]QNM82504.1 TIGR02587 family membrane protein [Sphingomonas sabuli]
MWLVSRTDATPRANLKYLRALGRGLAGAILFSLPLLMTMEMWMLGFYLPPGMLFQFLLLNLAMLVGMSRVSGFEATGGWGDDVMDAFSAYAVAFIWSAVILWLLGIVKVGMPASELVGKIAIESVPASFGAMLGSKQLGRTSSEGDEKVRKTYSGQIFLMAAGALFFAFNVAPTEEMILISFRMTPWLSILLMLASLLLLHTLVYTIGLKGSERPDGPLNFWSVFFRFSVVGYAVAAIVCLYLLWTFGRVQDTGMAHVVGMVAVVAFPGAIGAAIARLII